MQSPERNVALRSSCALLMLRSRLPWLVVGLTKQDSKEVQYVQAVDTNELHGVSCGSYVD
jgi:hypothetical protein